MKEACGRGVLARARRLAQRSTRARPHQKTAKALANGFEMKNAIALTSLRHGAVQNCPTRGQISWLPEKLARKFFLLNKRQPSSNKK